MKHRHHRQHRVAHRQPHGIGHRHHHSVQHVGAMAVEHALRLAGRAGGVAHAGRPVLVDLSPGEVAVDLADPVLHRPPGREARSPASRRVGQHDHLPQRIEFRPQGLDQRQEARIAEQHAVLGVVHDPGDLVGKQPRIEGVIDTAHPHDAVPGFQVTGRVPGERGHALARLIPGPRQALCQLERAAAQLGIGRAHDRPLQRARHDLAPAMLPGGMVEDLVAQQRPFLHETVHLGSSRSSPAIVGAAADLSSGATVGSPGSRGADPGRLPHHAYYR